MHIMRVMNTERQACNLQLPSAAADASCPRGAQCCSKACAASESVPLLEVHPHACRKQFGVPRKLLYLSMLTFEAHMLRDVGARVPCTCLMLGWPNLYLPVV